MKTTDQSLRDHIDRTGTVFGVCVVYPFHGSYPGMPDLFHVRCSEHPDFGLCAEWGEARSAAVEHDAEPHSTDPRTSHGNGGGER